VLDFQTKSTSISSDIDAQLGAIRADFGIAANVDLAAALKAQITAHANALEIEAEPARCAVDAQATLRAQAKCDVSVDPGKASVECKGSCEVEASAAVKCDADADLRCTVVAPSATCTGECKGSCEGTVGATADCKGTCSGKCNGTCSAYVMGSAGAECAGTCDGTCMGSCKVELAAEAKCEGKCEGECTVTNPTAGCEGGIRAECKAKANAMVACTGRCNGDFEPPSASAECEATASAQAKLNVECTPPRLAVRFEPKLTVGLSALELKARLQFVAAVQNLEVRLPALLASIERARSVGDAYTELSVNGRAAIKAAADAGADGNLRVTLGLACAARQLNGAGTLLASSNTKLKASFDKAASLKSALSL
jgi:hypothetical protein